MRDDEKKFFSDETICEKIKSDIEDCFLSCLFATLGIGAVFGFVFWIIYMSSSPFIFKWLFASVCAVVLVCYYVKKTKKAMYLLNIIKNKAFAVHEDVLERIGENEYNAPYGPLANRYVNAFYFRRFGRFVPYIPMDTYSLVGDKFYIVSFDCDSEKPFLIFPAKIYDYKQ